METLVKPSTLFWDNLDYVVQKKNVNYLFLAKRTGISKSRLKKMRDEKLLPASTEIDRIANALNVDYYVLFEDHIGETREDDILPRQTELTISEIFFDNVDRFNQGRKTGSHRPSLRELCMQSGVKDYLVSSCRTQGRLPKESIIVAFSTKLKVDYIDLFDDWSDIS